jgi:hypothetical protein
MVNRVEKLSLLSEMIAFAQKDKATTSFEYSFLRSISRQLEISDEDFNYLYTHPITYVNVTSHSERIVQFHRLVLLMNLNPKVNRKDLIKLHNFGLRMGLNHDVVNRVLELMDGLPNKMIPSDFLIDIFKVQYN